MNKEEEFLQSLANQEVEITKYKDLHTPPNPQTTTEKDNGARQKTSYGAMLMRGLSPSTRTHIRPETDNEPFHTNHPLGTATDHTYPPSNPTIQSSPPRDTTTSSKPQTIGDLEEVTDYSQNQTLGAKANCTVNRTTNNRGDPPTIPMDLGLDLDFIPPPQY